MTANNEPDPVVTPDVSAPIGRPGLDALSRKQRRRLYIWALLRPLLTTVLLVVTYFLMPLDHLDHDAPWVGLAFGVAVIVIVLAWQIREILHAQFPMLQAVEALAVVLPLFLLSFAATYVVMSAGNAADFTQPLSHMSAIYFTVVVFSTVGFGDITPHTDAARAVVTFQILGDLLLIAFGLRLVVAAVKRGQDRIKGGPGQS
ncbi:MAG TPA: ion channel [Candidatus Nanopelagicales bacterium]|jgi:hypothetical protein